MEQSDTIKLKRLELLNETAAHFNSSNRSVLTKGGNTCIYSGVGCAIGRKITDKELCARLDNMGYGLIISVNNPDVFNLLPEELKNLGQEFLRDVQLLHDREENWDEKGLNKEGLIFYDNIKLKYC